MSDTVRVSVPARAEYAKTVRLVAASLAARAGMSFEVVEDVRIAADEAFVLACEGADAGGVAEVEFLAGEDGLEFAVETAASGAGCEQANDRLEYARLILAAVCDEIEITEDRGRCRVRVAKRAAAEAPGG